MVLILAFAVGFGLTFGLNAAPLLITELAYPTQVSDHGNARARAINRFT